MPTLVSALLVIFLVFLALRKLSGTNRQGLEHTFAQVSRFREMFLFTRTGDWIVHFSKGRLPYRPDEKEHLAYLMSSPVRSR